jgi:predicted DNA-binding protein (MmcQ/YjbR family)
MTSKYPPVALPDTKYARELQAFCLALPGAFEDYPWGDIVYKVGAKMFAAIGGDPIGVTAKATKDDQQVLIQAPNISMARYVGQHGWVTIDIRNDDDFELAKTLIEASYDLIAPKRSKRMPA